MKVKQPTFRSLPTRVCQLLFYECGFKACLLARASFDTTFIALRLRIQIALVNKLRQFQRDVIACFLRNIANIHRVLNMFETAMISQCFIKLKSTLVHTY